MPDVGVRQLPSPSISYFCLHLKDSQVAAAALEAAAAKPGSACIIAKSGCAIFRIKWEDSNNEFSRRIINYLTRPYDGEHVHWVASRLRSAV